MNRRKFVASSSAIALGLAVPSIALAGGENAVALNQEQDRIMQEFRAMLAEHPFGQEFIDKHTTVCKINRSSFQGLDFVDALGNRVTLKMTKGRLVAKLH